MQPPLPAATPALASRDQRKAPWGRTVMVASLVVGMLAVLGECWSVLLGTGDHGLVLARLTSTPLVWICIGGTAALTLVTGWRRWRIVTVLLVVLGLAASPVAMLVDRGFSAPTVYTERVAAPDGQHLARIENHGFMEPYYKVRIDEPGAWGHYWVMPTGISGEDAGLPELTWLSSTELRVVAVNEAAYTIVLAVEGPVEQK